MPIIDQLDSTNGSSLSLLGEQGPTFESESERATSQIQAFVEGGSLTDSEDLYYGRTIGPTSLFCLDSEPPVSVPDDFIGLPYYPSLGGPYSQVGPSEGRY